MPCYDARAFPGVTLAQRFHIPSGNGTNQEAAARPRTPAGGCLSGTRFFSNPPLA